jgi:hypothetical protein
LFQKTLEVQLQVLGDDSPDAGVTMANLAAVYSQQKLAQEAEPLYRRAETILEGAGGNEQKLAVIMSGYARLLREVGKKSEAKKLEARASRISAARQNARDRFTVDVSDLLSPRR